LEPIASSLFLLRRSSFLLDFGSWRRFWLSLLLLDINRLWILWLSLLLLDFDRLWILWLNLLLLDFDRLRVRWLNPLFLNFDGLRRGILRLDLLLLNLYWRIVFFKNLVGDSGCLGNVLSLRGGLRLLGLGNVGLGRWGSVLELSFLGVNATLV